MRCGCQVNAASFSGNLHILAKPHPPQITCPALPQPPVQAPSLLLRTADAVFYLVVPHGMPKAGQSHTGRALCAMITECCLLFSNPHKPVKLQPPQTTCPALRQPPVQAPPHLLHAAEAAFDLTVPHGMPRSGHSRTGRALCDLVAQCILLLWKSPQTGKTAPPHKAFTQPCRSFQCKLNRTC